MDFVDLFSKLKIDDSLELENRMVVAPMTRARCEPFGPEMTEPNELMAEYYAQRASAGLVITEATSFSEEGYGWPNAPLISTKKNVENWKKVVDAVHAKGGKIFLQLWHLGRQAHSSFHPTTNDIVSASNLPITKGQATTIKGEKTEWEVPRPLTIPQIKQTVKDYVAGAQRCKEAGFDGVEVHGANGYLLDQFLQTASNVRTDEYGGSMENRARFLIEVVEALIADGAYPASRIGVRLSPNGNFGEVGSPDNDVMFPFVAKQLSKYGLAYLHVMDGGGFGFHKKCRPVTVFDMKSAFQGPIIANVELTKDVAQGMLRSGACDLACFGRLYISNPDLMERFKNNWPLNPDSKYEDWWKPVGAKGYTDFPFYKPDEQEEKQE